MNHISSFSLAYQCLVLFLTVYKTKTTTTTITKQVGKYVKQIFTFGVDNVLYVYDLALLCAIVTTQTVAMVIREQ